MMIYLACVCVLCFQVTIENDFIGTGPVNVTRVLNCVAPCSAYAWEVTFLSLYGVVARLDIDSSALTLDAAPGMTIKPLSVRSGS